MTGEAPAGEAGILCFPACSTPVLAATEATLAFGKGTAAGFQDEVQLDPSEDGIHTPGSARDLPI